MDEATPKRHAPRGRIKATDDPIDGDHPVKPTCTATNRQGKRCGKWPIPGGTVCRLHGGAAPQVKAKALERLMILQGIAVDALEALAKDTKFPSTRLGAAKDILDRTMGKPKETAEVEHKGGIELVWRDTEAPAE